MRIYSLPDGGTLSPGSPFEFGGMAYAGNWLALASDAELAESGVTFEDIPDPEPGPPSAPRVISDRQFFQQLALMGQITQDEALAAVMTGAIPAALESFIAALPQEQQFSARMLLSGATQFERMHPMTALLAQGMGWTQEQIEQLWSAAAQL